MWKSFELPKLPSGISTVTGSFDKLTGAVTAGLDILHATADTLASLEKSNLTTAQTLMQTAITTAQKAVDDLLKGTGVYVLQVPAMRKLVIAPQVQSALSWVSSPGLGISPDLTGYSNAQGGNKGFVRTVLESLEDTLDVNKPKFTDNTYVAGVYVVAGAADYSKLMRFVQTLAPLIGAGDASSDLEIPDLPAPKNLRVKGNRLDWDPTEPVVAVPTLGLELRILKTWIIRSTNPSILTKRAVRELFGSSTLSVGMKAGSSEVIAWIDDLEPYYYDESELSPQTAYYYTLAYEYETYGYSKLSNIAKATTGKEGSRSPKSSRGRPPDWQRTPSVIEVFPDLGKLVRNLSGQLTELTSYTEGYGDTMKAYVQSLETSARAYEARATSVKGSVDQLTALLGADPGIGMYVRGFSGKGGLKFFKQDLAEAFGASSKDENRPPFDADEFVTGFVILGAAPNAAGVAAVEKSLGALFGGVSASKSAIQEALSKLDVALRLEENTVFGDDLAVPPESIKGLPSIGNEEDKSNCPKRIEMTVEFDDSMAAGA